MIMYRVNKQKCIGCQVCLRNCAGAMSMGPNGKAEIVDQEKLEECGGESVCPLGAIEETGADQETQPQSPAPSTGGRGIASNQGTGRGHGMGAGRGQGRGAGGGRGGGGGRMGGPKAGGPSGNCICPNCGHKVPHQAGQPCFQKKCPECGSPMTRE